MTRLRAAVTAFGTALSVRQMQEPVLRFTTRLAQIDAMVTGKHGMSLPDLARDDFRLFQDGKRQAITYFSYVAADGGADPIGTLDEDENRQDQAVENTPSRVKPQTLREFEQLRDMPGRKSVILFSDRIQLFASAEDTWRGTQIPG